MRIVREIIPIKETYRYYIVKCGCEREFIRTSLGEEVDCICGQTADLAQLKEEWESERTNNAQKHP